MLVPKVAGCTSAIGLQIMVIIMRIGHRNTTPVPFMITNSAKLDLNEEERRRLTHGGAEHPAKSSPKYKMLSWGGWEGLARPLGKAKKW